MRIIALLLISFWMKPLNAQTVVEIDQSHPLVSKPAPDIKSRTLSGRDFDLSAYKGKTVMLHIWSLSCAACFKELPDLNKLVHDYDGKDVVLISLMDNPADKLFERMTTNPPSGYRLKKKVFENDAIDFEIIPDAIPIIRTYTLQEGYPQTFFIDGEGIVRDYVFGYLASPDWMQGMVKNIDHLKEKLEAVLKDSRSKGHK
jgi:thiol-disulfide isomerase/thioredoxin